MKHHPQYEFRNYEEHHVDGYRHWLHGRADYYNTETYPGDISPWEEGKKMNHMIYLLFPIFAMYYFTNSYRSHLRTKNIKMDMTGVFNIHSA